MHRVFFFAFQMVIVRKFSNVCLGLILIMLLDNLGEETINRLVLWRSVILCNSQAFKVSAERQNQSWLVQGFSVFRSDQRLINREEAANLRKVNARILFEHFITTSSFDKQPLLRCGLCQFSLIVKMRYFLLLALLTKRDRVHSPFGQSAETNIVIDVWCLYIGLRFDYFRDVDDNMYRPPWLQIDRRIKVDDLTPRL